MDFLSALKIFKKWALKALPKAISKNRELREEIRGIVGDLADDLMNGLSIVVMRLRAARRIGDDKEFLNYLSESEQQIFTSFSEFRVCADLRNLEDRFNRFFDPARTAVEIGNISEVNNLISSLEDYERIVFDMVQSPWGEITNAVNQNESREVIQKLIDNAVKECEDKRTEVRDIAREIIDIV